MLQEEELKGAEEISKVQHMIKHAEQAKEK
jgi:hypothetical protein